MTDERNQPDTVPGPSHDDPPILSRRSPIGQSESGLASRDYRPVHAGPKLVASWPIGPAPGADSADADWKIPEGSTLTVQKNILSAPHLGPVDHVPLYLVVCGRGRVDDDEATLTVDLSNPHLSGKPYEKSLDVSSVESTPFLSPTVEIAPDRGDYEQDDGRRFPEYRLDAVASGGVGYLDAGTGVQLWSE